MIHHQIIFNDLSLNFFLKAKNWKCADPLCQSPRLAGRQCLGLWMTRGSDQCQMANKLHATLVAQRYFILILCRVRLKTSIFNKSLPKTFWLRYITQAHFYVLKVLIQCLNLWTFFIVCNLISKGIFYFSSFHQPISLLLPSFSVFQFKRGRLSILEVVPSTPADTKIHWCPSLLYEMAQCHKYGLPSASRAAKQ